MNKKLVVILILSLVLVICILNSFTVKKGDPLDDKLDLIFYSKVNYDINIDLSKLQIYKKLTYQDVNNYCKTNSTYAGAIKVNNLNYHCYYSNPKTYINLKLLFIFDVNFDIKTEKSSKNIYAKQIVNLDDVCEFLANNKFENTNSYYSLDDNSCYIDK